MDQTLLTCPLCKRENEAGTRFCRNCGRLLVEADLGVSTTEHAPLYDAQTGAPARWDGEAAASEGSSDAVADTQANTQANTRAETTDATSARIIIRALPAEAGDSADAQAQRVGEYALNGQTITIGRTQGCDIIFDGDTLTSRRHAILRCEANLYTIADLGSSNGTFLNDLELTAPTALQHGDRILIGQHELLFLLDQPQAIAVQPQAPMSAEDAAEDAAEDVAEDGATEEEESGVLVTPGAEAESVPQDARLARPTSAPAPATAKHASVARLSSELAASASRMAAPSQDSAGLDAIRTQLLEVSEALTRQAGLQTALAERRRATLVEARERVADLIADLRGDDPTGVSPVQHVAQPSLHQLVESIADDPENLERLQALASRAGELAQALRAQGPSEGAWSYERARVLRDLEDIHFRLQQQP